MASGLPVIATTVGGQTDIVSENRTGLLFQPTDVEAFAAHLAQYRDNAALRATHGVAGLAAARTRSWRQQVGLLMQHYASAAPASPQPSRRHAA